MIIIFYQHVDILILKSANKRIYIYNNIDMYICSIYLLTMKNTTEAAEHPNARPDGIDSSLSQSMLITI